MWDDLEHLDNPLEALEKRPYYGLEKMVF